MNILPPGNKQGYSHFHNDQPTKAINFLNNFDKHFTNSKVNFITNL